MYKFADRANPKDRENKAEMMFRRERGEGRMIKLGIVHDYHV